MFVPYAMQVLTPEYNIRRLLLWDEYFLRYDVTSLSGKDLEEEEPILQPVCNQWALIRMVTIVCAIFRHTWCLVQLCGHLMSRSVSVRAVRGSSLCSVVNTTVVPAETSSVISAPAIKQKSLNWATILQ